MKLRRQSVGTIGPRDAAPRAAVVIGAAFTALFTCPQAARAQVTGPPDYVTEDPTGALFSSGGSTSQL
jgi:hypothetical protein